MLCIPVLVLVISSLGNFANAVFTDRHYILNLFHNDRIVCGASLISNKCALTAAHCLHTAKPSEFQIYGTKDKNWQEYVRAIDKVILHPEYAAQKNGLSDLDFVIIVLNDTFANTEMKPVPVDYNAVKGGDPIEIAGWGLNTYNEGNQALEVIKTIVDTEKNCARMPGPIDKLFCSSTNGWIVRGSGRPVTRDSKLVGIVTAGYGCHDCEKSLTFYLRLGHPKIGSFIKETLEKSC